MPGYPTERFVDLSPELAEEFQCSICHCILSDAVDTKCRHSYCYECIEQWLTLQPNKQCPQCNQSVVTNNRSAKRTNNKDPKLNELTIGADVVVYRNRTVNGAINRLRVKCEWEANGCTDAMALDGAAHHSGKCPFRVCKRCQLLCTIPVGKDAHDCVDSLLSDKTRCVIGRDELCQKVTELTQINDQLVASGDRKDDELDRLRRENSALQSSRDQKHDKLTKLERINSELIAKTEQNLTDLAQIGNVLGAKCNELSQRVISLEAEDKRLRTKCTDSQNELYIVRKTNAIFMDKQNEWVTNAEKLQQRVDTLLAEKKQRESDDRSSAFMGAIFIIIVLVICAYYYQIIKW